MKRQKFHSWRPMTSKSGLHMKTLHEWGTLSEIESVRNVAALLAKLCDQDEAAIADILVDAIWSADLPFWGIGAGGGGAACPDWRPNYLRIKQLVHPQDVSRSEPDANGNVSYTLKRTDVLDEQGRQALHLEAVGLRPSDAVALLVKRGRPVPASLSELLPRVTEPVSAVADEDVEPNARGVPASRAQEDAILAALRRLGLDPLKMERAPSGNKPWPLRDQIRNELRLSKDQMKKAWQRLRADGRIKDA